MSIGPSPSLGGGLAVQDCPGACEDVCDPKYLPICTNDCWELMKCCDNGGGGGSGGGGSGGGGGGNLPPALAKIWGLQNTPPGYKPFAGQKESAQHVARGESCVDTFPHR